MCTYYRTIKNGSVKEFKFELDRNTYILTNYQDITFYFTVEKRFIHFTIYTGHKENMGYGTALLSIVLDYAKMNNYDFVSGKLAKSDYDNGNWKTSIPFYLKQSPNAFLIKTTEFMRNLYPKYDTAKDFFDDFKHYYSYNEFVEDFSEGHIIYPMVMLQNHM